MNNNNKFNKTINPSGAEPPLGWWKFRKNRYITINHPSITNKEKCAFKLETILSPQEKQILVELLEHSKHLREMLSELPSMNQEKMYLKQRIFSNMQTKKQKKEVIHLEVLNAHAE